MVRLYQLCIVAIVLCMIPGCTFKKKPYMVDAGYNKKGTRLIAVMPVNNRTADGKAAEMLRGKILNELYFKGYPKIPLQFVDEKLSKVYKGYMDFKRENIPPKALRELLGVDAVLYATLEECSTSG